MGNSCGRRDNTETAETDPSPTLLRSQWAQIAWKRIINKLLKIIFCFGQWANLGSYLRVKFPVQATMIHTLQRFGTPHDLR